MKKKKVLYQITDRISSETAIIPWSLMPPAILGKISGDYYKSARVYSPSSGELESAMVLYFNPVKEFSDDVVTFEVPETDEVIFGVR